LIEGIHKLKLEKDKTEKLTAQQEARRARNVQQRNKKNYSRKQPMKNLKLQSDEFISLIE